MEPLRYQLSNVEKAGPHLADRCLLIDRNSGQADVLGSLYSAHLVLTGKKRNTILGELRCAAKLLSWSAETDHQLCIQLADGHPPTLAQGLAFATWLKKRSDLIYTKTTPAQANTYNSTLTSARRFIEWALIVTNSGDPHGMERALSVLASVWSHIGTIKAVSLPLAKDLTDDQIDHIESVLYSRAFSVGQKSSGVAFRDYLMWRISIEYGIRLGEMLSIRLRDLPSLNRNSLSIVRNEHRQGELDPHRSAPSVKTLGRDLVYFFKHSAFPSLFNIYVNEHRWVWSTRRSGQRFQRSQFPHEFLLIGTRTGDPLSIQAAETRADEIERLIGFPFGWHTCRHAFFNRAYEEMDKIRDQFQRDERKAGLVYWGGWLSESSLKIYTRTQRQKKARSAGIDLISHWESPPHGGTQ